MPGNRKVEAVVFDVGETLINEDRMWRRWSAYLGVSHETLLDALSRAIGKREHHWEALRSLRPGLDVKAAISERMAAAEPMIFDGNDLYPDALACLSTLQARGYRVGICGNQPAQAETALRDCGFEADFIASSAGWGVEKPSPAFFEKVRQAASTDARAIAYVGDRLDNDILPARAAGMVGVFVERGPWGRVHAGWPEVSSADIKVADLMAIPTALDQFGA